MFCFVLIFNIHLAMLLKNYCTEMRLRQKLSCEGGEAPYREALKRRVTLAVSPPFLP